MFKKKKDSKAVQAFVASCEKELAGIEKHLAEAESITDVGEKVLALQVLDRQIDQSIKDSEEKLKPIAMQQTAGTALKFMGGSVGVLALCLFLGPAAQLFGLGMFVCGMGMAAIAGGKQSQERKAHDLKSKGSLAALMSSMRVCKQRIGSTLDKTVQERPLNDFANSPRFDEALSRVPALRERFTDAKTLKAAFGGKPAPSAQSPAGPAL